LSEDESVSHSDNRKLKARLRGELRDKRRSLTPGQRQAADRRLCENIRRIPVYRRAHNVAVFLAFDGEPSLAGLYAGESAKQRRFNVPVIKAKRMWFAPLRGKPQTRKNHFGISEPSHRTRTLTCELDIVLVPLVGFDDFGNRLGMGGGFYDRHFSYLRSRSHFRRPRLIGVAYESQRVTRLPTDHWDVPMWAVVTDRGIHKPRRRACR
jgi:5-formyltetrahydrofolate cyclo-ligase